MTITKADVANLQPGDVVEVRNPSYTSVTTRGPLHEDRGRSLWLAAYVVRFPDGEPGMPEWPLTVISRAKPPLYVNSDKTEPTRGDVARDDSNDLKDRVWVYEGRWWHWIEYPAGSAGLLANVRLRLLVDGRTGTTVPQ